MQTIEDMAEIGVKGIVLMSDGENTLSPYFVPAVLKAKALGLSVALATNGFLVNEDMAEVILPALDYIRINFSAGTPESYGRIMGVSQDWFWKVADNIQNMVKIKKRGKLPVTINMSMVLQPEESREIMPFADLAKNLGVDYAIIKHCLDYDDKKFNINYEEYQNITALIKEAESLSTEKFFVTAKYSKMESGWNRSYQNCYGPAFLLQISGTGLVAACGPTFHERYKEKFHIGNIKEKRFKEIWQSDRYLEVMNFLRSKEFDTSMCPACGCVQDGINRAIDSHFKGEELIQKATGQKPEHRNFI